MKRQGWIGFLIGIFFCLLMVLPPVVQASLDVDGNWSGVLLLNSQNQSGGTYWDGTDNTDAYIRAGINVGGLAGDTGSDHWSVFNTGNVSNGSASGIIFGRPWFLESGTVYNNGYIYGDTNGIKMGAGTVTNGGMIHGDYDYGIYQYSLGASNFTVINGVTTPLTVSFDPDTHAMTVTPGTPTEDDYGIGTIEGYGGGIYSYIGGAGTATVTNYGTIIGYGGSFSGDGVALESDGDALSATVNNSGTIIGGYGGYYGNGVDIRGFKTATVTNSSNIWSYDSNDYDAAVYIGYGGSANVTNSGDIWAYGDGIYIENTNTVTVTNEATGKIYSDDYDGIYIDSVGSAKVTNLGIIDGDEEGVHVSDADSATVLNGATMNELGEVTVVGGGEISGYEGVDFYEVEM